MATLQSHKELIVWQKSIELAILVYALTKQYPKEETYGVTSQMRRSSVSIASNIAEGRSRGTTKDFLQFLRIAYGSAMELETQLLIARRVISQDNGMLGKTESLLNEVLRMLNVMIRRISEKSRT